LIKRVPAGVSCPTRKEEQATAAEDIKAGTAEVGAALVSIDGEPTRRAKSAPSETCCYGARFVVDDAGTTTGTLCTDVVLPGPAVADLQLCPSLNVAQRSPLQGGYYNQDDRRPLDQSQVLQILDGPHVDGVRPGEDECVYPDTEQKRTEGCG
jgi:hypothetical protein